MMLRRLFLISTSLLLIAALVGGGVMLANDWNFSDLRREARIALGLPKFWSTNFHEDVSSKTVIDCPSRDALVIVTGGQSNAANSYGDVDSTETDPQLAMVHGGKCYALESPVLGATARGESLWPRLGQALANRYDRPVVFINGAVGTTQVSDWLDDRSGYLERINSSISDAQQLGYQPNLVLWIQGETDAGIKVDPEAFKNDFESLIGKVDSVIAKGGAAADWVLYRSSYCKGRENNGPELEAAIAQLTEEKGDRLYLGPTLTPYDDTYRWDGCHLNRKGRDRLIEDTMAFLEANNSLVE